MNIPDKCSHGKTWEEQCADCESISKAESLQWCAGMARRAAAFYEKYPGHIQPATIIDLYRTVARIAELAASNEAKG